MRGVKLDLMGKRFSKLTVVGREVRKKNKLSVTYWQCKCDCGKFKLVRGSKIVSGKIKSCGCARKFLPELNSTSAKVRLKTYNTWKGMFARCSNPNNKNWKYYGAKGIVVCQSWFKFSNFLEDMGERPEGMSIDRIEGNGNYELKNCRWATSREQANNTSKNKIYVFFGEEMTIGEAANCFSIPYSTLHRKITLENIKPEKAVFNPK